MKPYYEHGGITIYHGDCREILRGLCSDVVIADPPYNAGKEYGEETDDRRDEAAYSKWMVEVLNGCSDASMGNVLWFPGTRNVWRVSEWLARTTLKPLRMLAWHKKEFAGDKWRNGPAMCWEPIIWASHATEPKWNRIFGTGGRDLLVVNATHGNPYAEVHPCPKPIQVMRWLISLFAPQEGEVIFPFAGSGTGLKAAKDLGRKAIGIEIEEKYCEIAAKRLSQEVLKFQ